MKTPASAPVAAALIPAKPLTPASPGKISGSPSLTGAIGVGMLSKPLNATSSDESSAAGEPSLLIRLVLLYSVCSHLSLRLVTSFVDI